MPPPYIGQCFWTFPKPGDVPAGQLLPFAVVIPPPATAAASTVFPVSGSSVSWMLQDDTGRDLVAGVDYRIVDGGLAADRLSVVFKPPATDKNINIFPKLSLFYGPTTVLGSATVERSDFQKQTFTLKPVTSDALANAKAQIAKAVALVADKIIIEPGDPATLRIVPKSILDIPQVVTSILHERPHVKIKGAIPLDSIVEAFLSPVKNLLGQFVPSSKATVDEAGLEVRKLLGQNFSIPLALDIQGDTITETLAPLGAPEIPLLSFSPDAQSLTGIVPIGGWPATFSAVSVTWILEEPGPPPSRTVFNDLSPGVNFLKSFLLRPDIVQMSVTSIAPTPITVTATLSIKIDLASNEVDISLPPVTLQRLPLPLPQIAAVFRHCFDDYASSHDQHIFLTVDSQSAPFVSSLSDCLDIITRLASVLNKIVAVAATGVADWKDFTDLATGFGVLADQVRWIPPGWLFFQPCLSSRPGPCINLSSHAQFKNAISAIIAIGVPSENPFVLSHHENSGLYIKFGKTYSSIMPCLLSFVQIPPDSASNDGQDPNLVYNDRLNVLGYGRRA
jgi:hypothetical protein